MSDNESDYEYVGGADLIQPDLESRTFHWFHQNCRPEGEDGYEIVEENAAVNLDLDRNPIRHVCPACGHEILTTRRTS